MNSFDRSTTAFQEFIGTLRQQWANQLYPALHNEYQTAAQGQDIRTAEEAGAQVSELPLYHWFCFIERHYHHCGAISMYQFGFLNERVFTIFKRN